MTALPKSFWPEFEISSVLSPELILKQAAAELAEHTGNQIEAVVDTEIEPHSHLEESTIHSFCIVAPALDRYSTTLFTASHDSTLVYPVWVSSNVHPAGWQVTCNSEAEFVAAVKEILAQPKTRGILYGLAAKLTERSAVKSHDDHE